MKGKRPPEDLDELSLISRKGKSEEIHRDKKEDGEENYGIILPSDGEGERGQLTEKKRTMTSRPKKEALWNQRTCKNGPKKKRGKVTEPTLMGNAQEGGESYRFKRDEPKLIKRKRRGKAVGVCAGEMETHNYKQIPPLDRNKKGERL